MDFFFLSPTWDTTGRSEKSFMHSIKNAGKSRSGANPTLASSIAKREEAQKRGPIDPKGYNAGENQSARLHILVDTICFV